MVGAGEIRKVAGIFTDAGGRTFVRYQRKQVAAPNQPWLFGHAVHLPPLLEEFSAQCDRPIGRAELSELRRRGVLAEYE